MRCPRVGNSFTHLMLRSRSPGVPPSALRPRLNEPGRSVLVAFIQGVVRARHEHLPPLHEAGGKKARDRAKDDFLGEGAAHDCFYEAEAMPSQGSPGLRPGNPKSQFPNPRQFSKCAIPNLYCAGAPLIIGIWNLLGIWILGFGISAPEARSYQNPHCRVAIIQAPRSRLVAAWAITHDIRLPVR